MARRKSKDKKNRLCIYLFNDTCSCWDDVLKDSSALDSYSVSGTSDDVMSLFSRKSISNPPKWLSFFDGVLDKDIEGLYNSSSSAVLLVNHNGRIFAFTFGYARGFLNLGVVEEDFGLKVALNSIEQERIRSVDIKNLDTVVRQSKVQTLQAGSVDNFGLNPERDILNAVTGISKDEYLGKHISGATALHISVPVKVDGLQELCARLLERFADKTYQEYFPWVDHIKDVKNSVLIEELNGTLVNAILEKDKDFERIFLAAPELVDWEKIEGFKFSESDEEEPREDIHISDILPPDAELKDKVNLSWLKRQFVYCVGANNDEIVDSWHLYSCINYEVKKGDSSYILTSGKWFEVDAKYAGSVDDEIKSIPIYDRFAFPEHEGEKEDVYNKKAYDSDTSRCVLMDKKLIPYGGGQNKIEFCDLLIDKKDFIHVKRFRGSSALSHLFFQGLTSAFLLKTEMRFLKEVNKKLPSSCKFDETVTVDASQYEVVFAVISKVKKQVRDIFPFFSRVSLLHVYKQLLAYDYKVSIAKISVKK
ncbi:TIGR04141 family sporadically distributed protein [Candidatus Woesearchaeota archaeon]|nr:TIGR04141 family sporadically distributed protein [Candidatus Woesearchaeota archaeon]